MGRFSPIRPRPSILELDRSYMESEALCVNRPEPDCTSCKHHFVTYESQWPHGCRAFEFKSKQLPRITVRQSSGQECGLWEPRTPPGKPPATPRT
jgi:hypothetical protein